VLGVNVRVNRSGFTLAEIITTLIILSVLVAIAVPTMIGLMQGGQQKARMNNARTVYLVAQDRLAELRITKNLKAEITGDYYEDNFIDLKPIGERSSTNVSYQAGVTLPPGEEFNANLIHFISKPAGDARLFPDNEVVKLLGSAFLDRISLEDEHGRRINDSILDGAILIEYNIETGGVLSVFYSDVLEDGVGFTYDATKGDAANITGLRGNGYEFAERRQQGYFSVSSTGVGIRQMITSIEIHDNIASNRLFALITIPDDYLMNNYEIELFINNQVTMRPRGNLFAGEDVIIKRDDLTVEPGHSIFEWVLDYIGSDMTVENPPFSFESLYGTRFGGVIPLNINVQIKVWREVPDGIISDEDFELITDEGEPVTSGNAVNLYFDNTSTASESVIRSARHLYNVRHMPDKDFKQVNNIAFFAVTNFAPIEDFEGNYNGNGSVISGLSIDLPEAHYAGLFANILEDGEVSGLTLINAEIAGAIHTGGIAGINEGIITQCIVRDSNISGGEFTGGIAGVNNEDAVIEKCVVIDCEVIAAVFDDEDDDDDDDNEYQPVVGGIIGINDGTVSESAVFYSVVNPNDDVCECDDDENDDDEDCLCAVVGGIAGINTGLVTNVIFLCVKGFDPDDRSSQAQLPISANAGGIAGINDVDADDDDLGVSYAFYLAPAPKNASDIFPIIREGTDAAKQGSRETCFFLIGARYSFGNGIWVTCCPDCDDDCEPCEVCVAFEICPCCVCTTGTLRSCCVAELRTCEICIFPCECNCDNCGIVRECKCCDDCGEAHPNYQLRDDTAVRGGLGLITQFMNLDWINVYNDELEEYDFALNEGVWYQPNTHDCNISNCEDDCEHDGYFPYPMLFAAVELLGELPDSWVVTLCEACEDCDDNGHGVCGEDCLCGCCPVCGESDCNSQCLICEDCGDSSCDGDCAGGGGTCVRCAHDDCSIPAGHFAITYVNTGIGGFSGFDFELGDEVSRTRCIAVPMDFPMNLHHVRFTNVVTGVTASSGAGNNVGFERPTGTSNDANVIFANWTDGVREYASDEAIRVTRDMTLTAQWVVADRLVIDDRDSNTGAAGTVLNILHGANDRARESSNVIVGFRPAGPTNGGSNGWTNLSGGRVRINVTTHIQPWVGTYGKIIGPEGGVQLGNSGNSVISVTTGSLSFRNIHFVQIGGASALRVTGGAGGGIVLGSGCEITGFTNTADTNGGIIVGASNNSNSATIRDGAKLNNNAPNGRNIQHQTQVGSTQTRTLNLMYGVTFNGLSFGSILENLGINLRRPTGTGRHIIISDIVYQINGQIYTNNNAAPTGTFAGNPQNIYSYTVVATSTADPLQQTIALPTLTDTTGFLGWQMRVNNTNVSVLSSQASNLVDSTVLLAAGASVSIPANTAGVIEFHAVFAP
jgi:prepilin-type N-terminal cleavage/methylation domain-containing protein